MRGLSVFVLAFAFLAGGAANVCAQNDDAPHGTIVEFGAVKSAFVAPIRITVWLPPGYAQSRMRYAVLYMLDGQNLFDRSSAPANSFFGEKWGVDTIAAELMDKGAIRPAIVVGIANLGTERARQYTPRGVYDRLPAPVRHELDREFGGKPFSDNYLRFLTQELKPLIDNTYRTQPDRDSTFIMGASMGGLAALYASTEYPDVFGGAACLSTHWPLTVPVTNGLSLHRGQPLFAVEVKRAFVSYLRRKLPAAGSHRLWFDRGTKSLDAFYGPYQRLIDKVLMSRGWQPGLDFQSLTFKGATHNEEAWRARLAASLEFLLEINEQRGP